MHLVVGNKVELRRRAKGEGEPTVWEQSLRLALLMCPCMTSLEGAGGDGEAEDSKALLEGLSATQDAAAVLPRPRSGASVCFLPPL